MFLSWSLIFFSISASVRVSRRGHHWSASPVLRIAISTVGRGFSLQGNRAAPISGPRALPWLTSTGTTQHQSQCFRLQHSFFALLRIVWFPQAHHRLLVTPLWNMKFLGEQLHPSPATTGEGFMLDLQCFPTQAVTPLTGGVQPQKAQLIPIHLGWTHPFSERSSGAGAVPRAPCPALLFAAPTS